MLRFVAVTHHTLALVLAAAVNINRTFGAVTMPFVLPTCQKSTGVFVS